MDSEEEQLRSPIQAWNSPRTKGIKREYFAEQRVTGMRFLACLFLISLRLSTRWYISAHEVVKVAEPEKCEPPQSKPKACESPQSKPETCNAPAKVTGRRF